MPDKEPKTTPYTEWSSEDFLAGLAEKRDDDAHELALRFQKPAKSTTGTVKRTSQPKKARPTGSVRGFYDGVPKPEERGEGRVEVDEAVVVRGKESIAAARETLRALAQRKSEQ